MCTCVRVYVCGSVSVWVCKCVGVCGCVGVWVFVCALCDINNQITDCHRKMALYYTMSKTLDQTTAIARVPVVVAQW